MSDLRGQRDLARRLEQTQVVERPGGVTGFTSFYDTGTFVPTLVGLTIAGTFTYDATETFCNWSRIGDRLLFNGRVRITAIAVAPTGALTISGFPYVAATLTTGSQPAGGATMIGWTLTTPATYYHVTGLFLEGESRLRLIRNTITALPASVLGGEFALVGGIGDFRFEGQYQV